MRITTSLSILFGLCVALGGAAHGAEDFAAQGYTPLFTGEDLSKWKIPEGDNGHWKVVDGVIG